MKIVKLSGRARYNPFMVTPRLIPVVSLLGENAVKTKSFKSPKYIGDPINTTALLSSFEVEELIVLDISKDHSSESVSQATLEGIIESAYMPIAYGGGISDVFRAREMFELGFDKIVVRTALQDSTLIRTLADEFGEQAITGCMDVCKLTEVPEKWSINGIDYSASSYQAVLEKVGNSGIGELIIQDVNHDGLRTGLTESGPLQFAIQNLEIPVVALGGCKDVDDAAKFIKTSGCHSIAASSMFLYNSSREAVLISYPELAEWHQKLEG